MRHKTAILCKLSCPSQGFYIPYRDSPPLPWLADELEESLKLPSIHPAKVRPGDRVRGLLGLVMTVTTSEELVFLRNLLNQQACDPDGPGSKHRPAGGGKEAEEGHGSAARRLSFRSRFLSLAFRDCLPFPLADSNIQFIFILHSTNRSISHCTAHPGNSSLYAVAVSLYHSTTRSTHDILSLFLFTTQPLNNRARPVHLFGGGPKWPARPPCRPVYGIVWYRIV